MAQLPADCIAPWDFAVRDRDALKDASACAIASLGLLKLHERGGDAICLKRAATLLQALTRHCANDGAKGGLLLHATADFPHGSGIDGSTMYGDYYYLKSLLKLEATLR